MKGDVAKTFEELHIYQRARELTNAVYALTRDGAFSADRGLVDQIRRAAVSVMSNAAEGFERARRPSSFNSCTSPRDRAAKSARSCKSRTINDTLARRNLNGYSNSPAARAG